MESLEQILAKSNPKSTLIEHIERAINVWIVLRRQISHMMNEDEEFWFRSFISVLFHDLGKTTNNFQDIIKKKKSYFDNEHIRHEFVSSAVLLAIDPNYYFKSPLSIYAVMSHHKPLFDGLFDEDKNRQLKLNPQILESFFEYAINKINAHWYNCFQIDNRVAVFITEATLEQLYLQVSEHLFKNYCPKLCLRDRKKYIFFKSILQISDWVGSGSGVLNNSFIYDEKFLKNAVIKKLKEDGKHVIAGNFNWRIFQKSSNIHNNIIAIAPTGSGKTEAALLWASKKNENTKIIYLLPTRVTSNAIFQRIKSYFQSDYVSVVHSSANFYRKEIEGDYTGIQYLYDKTFFKDISICTIDQVLTQGFNLGFWELKTFHCLNASIIIDEIHLYAPYTLGLIISSISYLKNNFNARFYIMSATMPLKLKELLFSTLNNNNNSSVKIIEDIELLNKARNVFEIREDLIDDLEFEIVTQIEKEKKILLVVNTVNEAIRLFVKYKNITDNIICYHSRFIQKDRVQKEKDVLDKEKQDDGFLLIATQVVEVSLDIDFDILYSENAPIDAIIQRAGRVNRKRSKENSKVIIFKETEITAKWVYQEPYILDNTFSQIRKWHKRKPTEKDLNQMVVDVYQDMDILNNEEYQKGLNAYNIIQENLHFIKDNMNTDEIYTREGLDTINVIPAQFEEVLMEAPVEEKVKHELMVRKSKEYKIEIYWDDKRQFRYIKADYSYEKGLVFDNKSAERPKIH